MKAKFWIPVVLAATFSTAALAHGGDRDDRRDWRDDRRDDYRAEYRHHHYMPPPPPPRAYGRYDTPHRHRYDYERRAYYPVIPLPPPPHVVLRELFR